MITGDKKVQSWLFLLLLWPTKKKFPHFLAKTWHHTWRSPDCPLQTYQSLVNITLCKTKEKRILERISKAEIIQHQIPQHSVSVSDSELLFSCWTEQGTALLSGNMQRTSSLVKRTHLMYYLTCHPFSAFNAQTWQGEGTRTKQWTVSCLHVTSTEGKQNTSNQ